MPIIRISTSISAPIERVFDLARSVDVHLATTTETQEKAIAGRKSGLLEYGDSVTWEARHLGRTRKLKVQITEFDLPNQFVDEMVSGPFRSLRHVHRFKSNTESDTEMIDELVFKAPMGPIGTLAERLLLTRYMEKFLLKRNAELKTIAETDRWRDYLPQKTNS